MSSIRPSSPLEKVEYPQAVPLLSHRMLQTALDSPSPLDSLHNLLKYYTDDPVLEQTLDGEVIWGLALDSLDSSLDDTRVFLQSLTLFLIPYVTSAHDQQ